MITYSAVFGAVFIITQVFFPSDTQCALKEDGDAKCYGVPKGSIELDDSGMITDETYIKMGVKLK